jgi:hypothetical protein
MNKGLILLFLTTCAVSLNACAAECRGLDGSELWQIDAQVAERQQVAMEHYFLAKPEDSLQSLRELIDTYRRAQCTSLVPDAAREAFQYSELLAVGRLARQYERLGLKTQSTAEHARALALGRTVLGKPTWSATDLARLIEEGDQKQRALLSERTVSPTPSQSKSRKR